MSGYYPPQIYEKYLTAVLSAGQINAISLQIAYKLIYVKQNTPGELLLPVNFSTTN